MAVSLGVETEHSGGPAGGADLVPAAWTVPDEIPATAVVELRTMLRQHADECQPVPRQVLMRFLGLLVSGCVRRPTDGMDDVARMNSMVFSLERYPAYCFTDDELRAAKRRYKFIPADAELIADAERIMHQTETTVRRARKIVETGPRAGRAKWNPDEQARRNREKADRERAELLAAIAQQPAVPHAGGHLVPIGRKRAGFSPAEMDASRQEAAKALAERQARKAAEQVPA